MSATPSLDSQKGITAVSFLMVILLIGLAGFVITSQLTKKIARPTNSPSIPLSTVVDKDDPLSIAQKDTDGDGLKDWEEVIINTDPKNPDTDSDGTPDGKEVDQGRSPVKAGPHDKVSAPLAPIKRPEKTLARIMPSILSTEPSRSFASSPEPSFLPQTTPLPSLAQNNDNAALDKEVFRRMNPPQFLNTVAHLQDMTENAHYIEKKDRIALTSEENIVSFFLIFIKYLRSEEVFTAKDYDQAKTILPGYYLNLRRWEAANLRQTLINGKSTLRQEPRHNFLSLLQPSYTVSLFSIKGLEVIARSTAEIITKPLTPPTAHAQAVCFQVGASNPAVGYNVFAPCCSCTANGYPIGCLNLYCEGQSAIYDQVTFICGCG